MFFIEWAFIVFYMDIQFQFMPFSSTVKLNCWEAVDQIIKYDLRSIEKYNWNTMSNLLLQKCIPFWTIKLECEHFVIEFKMFSVWIEFYKTSCK